MMEEQQKDGIVYFWLIILTFLVLVDVLVRAFY